MKWNREFDKYEEIERRKRQIFKVIERVNEIKNVNVKRKL